MRLLAFIALTISLSCSAQSREEQMQWIQEIEAEYGEQWDFCHCVVAQDSLNKAVMDPDITDLQFDSLMVLMDSIDNRCKAFLVMSAIETPEERAAHEGKVRDCLRRNELTTEQRFRVSWEDKMPQSSRIKVLDLHFDNLRAEFYARLHSFLHIEPIVFYGGYEFYVWDVKTHTNFKFRYDSGEFSYWSDDTSEETLEVIDLFQDYLFNDFSDLVSCYIEFEAEEGLVTCGYQEGHYFEEISME